MNRRFASHRVGPQARSTMDTATLDPSASWGQAVNKRIKVPYRSYSRAVAGLNRAGWRVFGSAFKQGFWILDIRK